MGGSISSTGRGWWVRLLVGGIEVLVCVAGGVYLGDALVRKPAFVHSPAELKPSISMGDLFPLSSYREMGGEVGSFDSLLIGRRTLLLFLSEGCGRCSDLLDLWNREIQPILKPDAQVIICTRDSTFPQELARLVGNRKVIIPDTQTYHVVGLKLTPTIIGLDEYGLVVYVQPGYTEFFGRDFYEHFAMTAE